MDEDQFAAFLPIIVPSIIDRIVVMYGCTEFEAIQMLYSSHLYEVLSDEETKLWHYSSLTLFNLFDEERRTGKITFPEEAA